MVRIEYETAHGTIGSGYIADTAESPLTGKLRFLVVDSHSEAHDPDAGRWIDAIDCWEPEPAGYRNGQHISQFI